MANDAIPPTRVIHRLLALTREGKIKWRQEGEGPSTAFDLQTESTFALLFKGNDGDRVGLQVRPASPQPDEFGHLDPALLFGGQHGRMTVDQQGRVTLSQPARVTVWSDDEDRELAGLVQSLYEEVVAQATVSDDPFAKLWSDLDAFDD